MLDQVTWVFFHNNPPLIGSYRLSGILPADYLRIKKSIFLENDDPKIFLDILKSNMLIFSKPFHKKAINLIIEAKKRNIKVITTCDDWNFINSNKKQIERNKILNDVSVLSDALVVKTKIAAEVVKRNTGLFAYVISDCNEFKSEKPIKKINYPYKLAWFGKHTNLDTLHHGILEILDQDYEIELKIITNFNKYLINFRKEIGKFNLDKILIRFLPWSESLNNLLINTDIIIIPYLYDKLRLVKSVNRITESLNLGKLVISSKMPFNKDLQKYIYVGHLGEGLKWANENNLDALNKVQLGNQYSIKNFNVEKIANDWNKLIKKILIKSL